MKREVTTIRWDSTEKRRRVEEIARARGLSSVNRLINSWADTVIAQQEAELSFRAAAAKGSRARLLALLDELDKQDKDKGVYKTRD